MKANREKENIRQIEIVQKPKQVKRQMDTEKSTPRLEIHNFNPLDDTELRSEGCGGGIRKQKEQGCLCPEYKSNE